MRPKGFRTLYLGRFLRSHWSTSTKTISRASGDDELGPNLLPSLMSSGRAAGQTAHRTPRQPNPYRIGIFPARCMSHVCCTHPLRSIIHGILVQHTKNHPSPLHSGKPRVIYTCHSRHKLPLHLGHCKLGSRTAIRSIPCRRHILLDSHNDHV